MSKIYALSLLVTIFFFLCSMSKCQRDFSFTATFDDNILTGIIRIYYADPESEKLNSKFSNVDMQIALANILSNLQIDIVSVELNGKEVAVEIFQSSVVENETDNFSYMAKFIVHGFNETTSYFKAQGRIINDSIIDGMLELYEIVEDSFTSRIVSTGTITGNYIEERKEKLRDDF